MGFHHSGRVQSPKWLHALPSAQTLGKGRQQTFGLDKTDDEKVLKTREVDRRWTGIVSNDVESIPLRSVSSELASWTTATPRGTQPHRVICWITGVLAILVGTGNAPMSMLLVTNNMQIEVLCYVSHINATATTSDNPFNVRTDMGNEVSRRASDNLSPSHGSRASTFSIYAN
ncbi:hypothetical protein PsorP6_013131 [Peronosclerospora sorghi]|uniref:Uncharacterized protein n=1 Tax=Peronosclerospora sorghi TaxID=230839 RepID=A0ACC0WG03_9STRA|nr:hypothetical protein PsorP6_013131 [Peronosclerospora sorghi]